MTRALVKHGRDSNFILLTPMTSPRWKIAIEKAISQYNNQTGGH